MTATELRKLDKVLDQLSEIHAKIARVETQIENYNDRVISLETDVKVNTAARLRLAGQLKLAFLIISLVGSSLLAVGGWMIHTTVVNTESIQDLERTIHGETP